MDHLPLGAVGASRTCLLRPGRLLTIAALLLVPMLSGCAALTNPVADPVPVRHVPQELLTPSKTSEQTIPLSLLGQPPARHYRLAAGDVLGVYIDGFIGDRNLPLPVQVNVPVQIKDQRRLPPSTGYPVTVQEDGTILLPSVQPLVLKGMSLNEAREAIKEHYKKLIKPEVLDRISVTLMQGRLHEVVVMRQEAQGFGVGPDGLIDTTKRGTGSVVHLPAYENDVLHALTLTGGLPGLDTCNEVIIQRRSFHDEQEREAFRKRLKSLPPDHNPLEVAGLGGEMIRIPLRVPTGCPLPFRPEDVILQSGDIVFLEAREDQWYFTGGLLPTGKHLLPRDHDIDVIEAVSEVHGPLLNGAFGGSNLSGQLIAPGLGSPSPTLLLVLRRMPGGGQVAIKVDLRRALNDPHERIRVQPGDLLVLQEKPSEALARYFGQTFLNFNMFWQVFRSSTATGVLDVAAPDRLPGSLPTVNIAR